MLINVALIVVGFLVLLAIQYIPLIAGGTLTWPTQSLLSCVIYQLIPIFAIVALVLTYFYRKTGHIYARRVPYCDVGNLESHRRAGCFRCYPLDSLDNLSAGKKRKRLGRRILPQPFLYPPKQCQVFVIRQWLELSISNLYN